MLRKVLQNCVETFSAELHHIYHAPYQIKYDCKLLHKNIFTIEMLIGEPLIYLQHESPYTICPVLEQTYLHLLFHSQYSICTAELGIKCSKIN